MNYPNGRRLYPQIQVTSPAVDFGTLGKHEPTGLARGSTAKDYNVKLRGLGERVDKKPGIM